MLYVRDGERCEKLLLNFEIYIAVKYFSFIYIATIQTKISFTQELWFLFAQVIILLVGVL